MSLEAMRRVFTSLDENSRDSCDDEVRLAVSDNRNLPPSSVGARTSRLLLAKALGIHALSSSPSSSGLGHGYRNGHKGEQLAANSTLFYHIHRNCPLLLHLPCALNLCPELVQGSKPGGRVCV